MHVAVTVPWTHERFFAWARTQEENYDFDGKEPVLVTRPNLGHSRIVANLLVALRARLAGDAWEVLGPKAGIETVGGAIRFPDIVIAPTGTPSGEYLVRQPVVVFEVLRPTSEKSDLRVKMREYLGVPSIRRYFVVGSDSVDVVMSEKIDERSWRTTPLVEGSGLPLPELSTEVPIAELYVGLLTPPDAA